MNKRIIDFNDINDTLIYEYLCDNYPLESNGALWDSFLEVAFIEDKFLLTNAREWFIEHMESEVKVINIPGEFKGKDSAKNKFLEIKKQRGL